MQGLKFIKKSVTLNLSNERTVKGFGKPILRLHKRTTTVITKLFPVFIKESAIAFGNICRNRISGINKLSTGGFLREVVPVHYNVPDIIPDLKSELINFKVFKFNCVHDLRV